MSRVQASPTSFRQQKDLIARVSAVERRTIAQPLIDIDTTGLSSAQIDTAIFGGSAQAYDGAQITDKTNYLLLVRESSHWYKVALTLIP